MKYRNKKELRIFVDTRGNSFDCAGHVIWQHKPHKNGTRGAENVTLPSRNRSQDETNERTGARAKRRTNMKEKKSERKNNDEEKVTALEKKNSTYDKSYTKLTLTCIIGINTIRRYVKLKIEIKLSVFK